MSSITIITRFSGEEINDRCCQLEAVCRKAGTWVEFTVDAIARTLAQERYGDWFDQHNTHYSYHYLWTDSGQGDILSPLAGMFLDPVDVHWSFDERDPEERATALQFKLTFGGDA